MSKRYDAPKRRDRKTGDSPYAKYHKAPYLYSGAYYAWRGQYVKRNKEESK